MVSMARPFLADPHFVNKAREDRSDEINTCIACNQACLDHIFKNKLASCLVNPIACRETEIVINKTDQPVSVAVVGAGPAGLACAITAAQRGHKVKLYDKSAVIGGQFNIAKQIPGKEEFYETIRYFSRMLEKYGVEVELNTEVTEELIVNEGFDKVVLATGVLPRAIHIEGMPNPKVLSYLDVIEKKKEVGKSVAIIGAGGIGFDTASFLLAETDKTKDERLFDVDTFSREWGIDTSHKQEGGLMQIDSGLPKRKIYLLQRTNGKLGKKLGKTTGWIHRSHLKHNDVEMIGGLKYLGISDEGLLVEQSGTERLLEVDNVVICAGQVPLRALYEPLKTRGIAVHLIGGADEAKELDAKRAIEQGTLIAIRL